MDGIRELILKGQFQGQQTRGERGECCLARSPPLPPLALAPFKICAHFGKGAGARGGDGGERGNQF